MNRNKEVDRKAVLENIQQQVKLKQQNAQAFTHRTAPNNEGPPVNTAPVMTPQQKITLQQAQQSSPGFFVVTDSQFGNMILPGIPRLEPPQPQT